MSVVKAFKIIANGDDKCNDFVFQIDHDFRNQGSLKTIGSKLKRDALLVTNQTGLTATLKCCLLHASASAIILRFEPLFNRKNRTGRFQDDILGGGTKHQFADF
jgi:hypothetical protein